MRRRDFFQDVSAFFAAMTGSAVCGFPNFTRADETKPAASINDAEFLKRWMNLSDDDVKQIVRRNIHGLVRAAHAYIDAQDTFPPAIVPNPKLPAEKRLSGLVLLLPYFQVDSWIDKGKPCFDEATVKLAKETYASIELTKAWDDPINLKAAKTVIPAFLSPRCGPIRDQQGFAVSHFAFVRGSSNDFDSAFPGDKGVKLLDIKDGTSCTLAFGEISHDLGPWIAEGSSTARQLHLQENNRPGTFGSRDNKTCWFSLCDSSSCLFRFDKLKPETWRSLATRSGGEVIDRDDFDSTDSTKD